MYKGKKIDADCNYLKLEERATWDDLILPKKDAGAYSPRVNEMFDLKEYLDGERIPSQGRRNSRWPSRHGQDGTLQDSRQRNQIETVIYAMPDHLGRTGDIKRVCEMAKDLAPCVLIIEDIDYIAEERPLQPQRWRRNRVDELPRRRTRV
jgi:hypothetical protein